jgi:hypothetical protein
VGDSNDVIIHSAVCADVDRMRRVLQLPEDEHVVSPLAEFWAGQDFRFQRPVTITLPHCLPENFDPHLVCVYRVSHGPNGQIKVGRVRNSEEAHDEDNGFP